MKCRSCDIVIDQATADAAADLVEGMGCETLCVECAQRIAKDADDWCPLCGTRHEKGNGPQGYSCAAQS